MSKTSLNDFYELLRTASSEVSKKNLFSGGRTVYIPDFFLIFFCLSLFSLALTMDFFIIYVTILEKRPIVASVFVITMLPHTLCELFLERNDCGPTFSMTEFLRVILFVLGFGPIIVCLKILTETFEAQKKRIGRKRCFPLQFFSMDSENLFLLKIFCCVYLAVKCIPQLMVVCVFILNDNITGKPRLVIVTNVLVNTLIFSLTIAITFPIRKTPRVFTSSTCILFNALNKFMATMCACCIHLAIFAMVFRKIKYLVLVVNLLKSLIWVWPCWRVLKFQPNLLSGFHFAVYLIFISLVFGFIYIHPFEGQGKLYYYFFYLVSSVLEIYVIYTCSPEVEEISYYYTLKILMFGFLSCYGLLNILHKYQDNKCGFTNPPGVSHSGLNPENKPKTKATHKSQTKFKMVRFSKSIESKFNKGSKEIVKATSDAEVEPGNSKNSNGKEKADV